jgi:hypothetical protein
MAKNDGKTATKQHDDSYYVRIVDDYLKEVKDFRAVNIDKQWMINQAYYRGVQDVKFNTTSKTLAWGDNDPLKYSINMVYTTIRAVKTAVTKYQPQWDVDSIPYGELSAAKSSILSGYLSALFEKLAMRRKIKEWVHNGLLCDYGVIQYGYDPTADNGEGESWVEVLDPFDTYVDPMATSLDDAKYVIKAIRRRLDDVRDNENYSENRSKVGEDNKFAESEFKTLLHNKIYKSSESGTDEGTVIVYEAWIRDKDGVKVITTADGELLRNETTDFEHLPFILYHGTKNPGEIYGESWVKNVIPLNRALNSLERSVLEFNWIFSKGRYLTDSDGQLNVITNENGAIIKHPRGTTLTQMDIKPMSSTPFNQIDNIMRYIQDVSGVQDAFLGRVPTSVSSGVAIEQLVANSYTNILDIIDNLEESLSTLGKRLLELGYKYNTVAKPYKIFDGDKDRVIRVVGANMAVQYDVEDEDVIELPQEANVKVRIISGAAYTKNAKQDLTLALRDRGLIDARSVLEAFELDADKIQARLQEEAQGKPVSEGGQPGEEEMQLPDRGDTQQLLDFVEKNGLIFSDDFQKPGMLEALVQGQVAYIIKDGTIYPAAPGEEEARVINANTAATESNFAV